MPPLPRSLEPLAVTDLRCQVPPGVLAAGAEPVRLTWRASPAAADPVQEAYEIEVATDPDFDTAPASSGVVEAADQVGVPAPGPAFHSRETRYYRVRIRTGRGWTEWSSTLRVEAGLLHGYDWEAQAVTLPDDPGRERPAPCPVLRREFDVGGTVARARIYVTALGLYSLKLNGSPVGDALLSPGWSTYRHRLLADTYDVTEQLREGSNVIVATLGDGWYRGRLGWSRGEDRCHYGREVGLMAQLEIDLEDGTRLRIVTDTDWLAATGEIRSADLYDGSFIDLRDRLVGCESPGYDTSGWQAAVAVPLDRDTIEPRVAPPVRVLEHIPSRDLPASGGTGVVRLDAGQNIAGFVRLSLQGAAGTTVTVRHAEVLEPDGSLHTRSLRSAKATDTYILADGRVAELQPAFTFHGFRHAEIETEAKVLRAEFVAISSDLARRGWFECSDQPLVRFHENVLWSQRDNFVSVPTDCPQRDERLGWTGDAQAFAPAACTLFDAEAFWASWMIDLALDQDDVLGVPTVVPDVVLEGEPRFGRAGWADAATIVPWSVYVSTGDTSILHRQLESMRRWVVSLQRREGPDGLLPESMQFGDWLDPDAPSDQPWVSKADSRYLANAFYARSAQLLSRVAWVLGEEDTAARYHGVAERIAAATWEVWSDHARTTQTGSAVALCFDLVPEPQRAAVAAGLARMVRVADGRVATGFLGTPLVLPALADAGYFEEAYLMLLRSEAPSWLYQVERGATTVWERWDAIRPDGSIHPGTMQAVPDIEGSDGKDSQMLSFNHYAYGAVIDWVYRHVAGLAPDADRPGYRHVVLAPKPVRGMDWASASVETAYGVVATSWRIEDGDTLVMEVELPFGTSGTFLAPTTSASRIAVDGEPAGEQTTVGPGHHTLSVTLARIVAGSLGGANTEPAVS